MRVCILGIRIRVVTHFRDPASFLAQYPRGGRGILYFLQILANPTSDKPYSLANRVMGVSQTFL